MSITQVSFSVLLSNLAGLFLLIGVGFSAVRLRLLPADSVAPMSALLLKITMPATIFVSLQRPFEAAFLLDGLRMIGLGFFLHFSYISLSFAAVRVFKVPRKRRGMWITCVSFCNNGFMGFPIAYALFGEEGLALAVMLGISFNLLLYTIGGKLVCMDQPEDAEAVTLSWRGAIFSVINLTIVLGLIFYCLQIPVPTAVLSPLRHLSNVTTPLSMFITGMSLATGRLREVFADREAISISLNRLLIYPLLTWGLLLLLPIENPLLLGVTLIIMAMPSPAVATLMAQQYNGARTLAAHAIFLSSLLCIATIPLIAMLL